MSGPEHINVILDRLMKGYEKQDKTVLTVKGVKEKNKKQMAAIREILSKTK